MADDTSAKAIIQQALDTYGLGHLAEEAWQEYLVAGDPNAVLFDMVNKPGSKLYEGFHARFPAYKELADSGRAISPEWYVQYEKSIMTMVQAYGIPTAMFDEVNDITKMLLNNVDVTEAKERFDMAAQAAYSAPAEVRDALVDEYGLTPGDLVGYWLDPERALPVLTRQWASAQLIGAASERAIDIGKEEAERLASLGVTYQQGREGFASAQAAKSFDTGPGERTDLGTRIDASFGDVEAKRKMRRVSASRVGEYEGGGGYAASQEGVSGLA